ncbi:small multidrug resistance pump [Brachybacterium sp. AG952]|uniref:DMT family transporter n=1 Tax=Brachybacterium sp. AG952 TaxID=2183989 RepID=UPI00105CD542|nr:SMR family transporter [Brachybacterium sp. AG952]TDP79719.1 small multidrug resistance pump [Brachybacterium sp. AG952]
MTSWLLLLGAIVTEVGAALSLRMSATGDRRWYLPVVVGYLLAFALLSGALAAGMPLGVAYGIWSAVGIVATAVLSRILFREPLTKLMLGGMGLIVVGVLLVELGGVH